MIAMKDTRTLEGAGEFAMAQFPAQDWLGKADRVKLPLHKSGQCCAAKHRFRLSF
jgi:hypothetical protein